MAASGADRPAKDASLCRSAPNRLEAARDGPSDCRCGPTRIDDPSAEFSVVSEDEGDENEDDEEARLLIELTSAAEDAAAAMRKLTQVLRRIDLIHRLQHLELLEAVRPSLVAESIENEIAEAAIARAMSARR
jgi:hypothetical protein